MKITFVSNFINHHQIPFSNEMYRLLGDNYHFIQTEVMEEERVKMGWQVEADKLPYLRCYYEEEQLCRELIIQGDAVIFGGVEDEIYIEERLLQNKLVIRYSERIYRSGQWKAISPRGLLKKYHDHTQYRKKDVYLLCTGGYVASDFHIIRAYPEKMFRWGYFTESKTYDLPELMKQKQNENGVAELLWTARLIPLKHPEYPILLAQRLKEKGYPFHLTMVGSGEMEETVRREIKQRGLEDVISLKGFVPPEEVRSYMEKAAVFLFTSDFREGWGAVINEAMNSGCAVVANHGVGSVPFLIVHKHNGLIYRNRKFADFYRQVTYLLDHPEQRESIGRAAYRTIETVWNPKVAAENLLRLTESLLQGKIIFAKEGPGSRAEVIPTLRMYSKLMKKEHGK